MNREIEKLVPALPASDGAGVKLNRLIGTPLLGQIDPFLMLDEFRSDDPNDYIAGFPEHPHRGFETVTYMLAGAMEHKDSTGNQGRLGPGDVQWMTAGKGIVHSEMPRQEQGLMWGFQLWVNLPAAEKMTEPKYQEIPNQNIPVVDVNESTSVKLVCGDFDENQAAVVSGDREIIFWDISVNEGQASLSVPNDHQGFIYLIEGAGKVEGKALPKGSLAILTNGSKLSLEADKGRFLLVLGKPIKEPIARHGPFVMNTRDEIEQAIDDYVSGNFVK